MTHVCYAWVWSKGSANPGVVLAPGYPTPLHCLAEIARFLNADEENLHYEKEWWPLALCPVPPTEGKRQATAFDAFRPVYHQDTLVAVLLRRK